MKYFKDLLGKNGLLESPIKVNSSILKKGKSRPLFGWGIFNPYGPTISFIGILEDKNKTIELIYHFSFNPFSQSAHIVGACDWDYSINQSLLLHELIDKNGGDDFALFNKGSMPTFILNLDQTMNVDNMIVSIFYKACLNTKSNIKIDTKLIKNNIGQPFSRATAELKETLKKESVEDYKLKEDDFIEWYKTIESDAHFYPEVKNFVYAWSGSIKHLIANNPITNTMSFKDLLVELNLLGFKELNGLKNLR